ncbi:NUDIX hydrolase [Lactiplantibacillus fabifermentans]|uniref:Mutt nudix family protein n=2 Tax=Lactiplantibacillus fabifermentans TaxID=483011 RepID=A0A0R2NUN9_9LACO|nr:NUDIX domain-containing protein [Lactiplantibacillus fabifermentans]ETY75054.1 phosphohydrolase [Lactiplantibacillus fabifermentans T30PCM01]KRO29481.1 mutt nudix family protein [Lactiplantibacillus fabifermentans DSM 21115]
MGYVLDLRKKVGHQPLVVAGAAVIALNTAGQLLLVHRNDNDKWGLPAGSTEPGESVATTARRELREETGLTVGDLQLVDVFSGPEMHYEYPNGDVIDSVTTLYQGTITGGALTPQTNETTAAAFFDRDQLPTPLTPLTAWMLLGQRP